MHSADRARAGLEGVRLTEAAPERVSLGAGVEIREAIADILYKERVPAFGRRVPNPDRTHLTPRQALPSPLEKVGST